MKSHRGISAIVGTVFLIAIVVGALSYITYSLETMANFSEQLVADESRQKNIQDEQFEITSVDVTSGNKLNAVIKNTGQIPLEITTLYIDEQGVNDVVNKTIIEKTIAPGTSFDFLTESIDIDIDPTKGYNLKMITSRGGSQIFSINSGSAEPLYMSLHILPTLVSQNFPVTILFVVVNNMTSNNSLYNLTPALDFTTGGTATETLVTGPIPTEYPVLKPGGIATFEYVYTVDGIDGNTANFGASLINGYPLPGDPSHLQSLNGTITVKDVELAISSGSSITSLGLVTPLSIEPELLFHDQSWGVPVGWPALTKHMDGATNFGVGSVFNTANGKIIFISSNKTSTESQTLLAGNYNASLQYYSNTTAPGVPVPSFAFFFECDNCPGNDFAGESTGNLDLIKNDQDGYLEEKDNDVAYTKYGGPHNDGYFTFSGEKSWLKAKWKSDTEETNTYSLVDNAPDTDAMWIRIPTATETFMPVVFYGENKDNKDKDRYEVYIGDYLGTNGFIFFNIEDDNGGTDPSVTCRTNDNYDNGKWQFLTVVRTDDTPDDRNNCEIWINGTNPAGTNTPGSTSLTTGYTILSDAGLLGDLKIKDIYLASVDENFKAGIPTMNVDLAMWMHWDDKDLEPSEIEELYYTNYGENGTRVHMQINHTNNDGSVIYSTLDVTDFEIPFYDPSANSTQSSGNPIHAMFDDTHPDALWKYSRFNVTGTTISSSSFVDGDRLTFSISVDDDEQNLQINLWIDDKNLEFPNTLDETNSFLQTPPIEPAWPTFSTIKSGEATILSIFNQGPEGIWFTFPGTRFIVSSLDGLTSYGAMVYCSNEVCNDKPITLNSETYPLNADQDGPYIPDQNTAQIKFNPLCDPVMKFPNNCDDIEAGDYNGYIYLSGYDEEGTSFIRTISLGLIHVTD